jgi:hypothetical protein
MRSDCSTLYRFRLAACQLDDLRSCIDCPRLMKALSALPTTLQGMYKRVLETLEISHCYREALFMLQYVLWARTPPLFPEMIDAIAVRLDESPGFKRENRLFELMDVITQCSSLLSPVRTRSGRQIHLAHSSVKEYLTSRQLAEPFQRLLAEVQARSVIAKTSIRYMIDVANIHHVSIKSSGKSPDDLHEMTRFEVLFVINSPNDLHKIPRPPEVVSLGNNLGKPRFLVSSEDGSVVTIMDNEHFPFLRSASYWAEQAQVVEAADDDIPRLVMQLYREEHLLRGFPQITGRGFIFYTYYSDYEYDEGLYTPDGYRPNPLIHACYWGLELVAQRLLDIDPDLITAGVIDSPLHAACFFWASQHCQDVAGPRCGYRWLCGSLANNRKNDSVAWSREKRAYRNRQNSATTWSQERRHRIWVSSNRNRGCHISLPLGGCTYSHSLVRSFPALRTLCGNAWRHSKRRSNQSDA